MTISQSHCEDRRNNECEITETITTKKDLKWGSSYFYPIQSPKSSFLVAPLQSSFPAFWFSVLILNFFSLLLINHSEYREPYGVLKIFHILIWVELQECIRLLKNQHTLKITCKFVCTLNFNLKNHSPILKPCVLIFDWENTALLEPAFGNILTTSGLPTLCPSDRRFFFLLKSDFCASCFQLAQVKRDLRHLYPGLRLGYMLFLTQRQYLLNASWIPATMLFRRIQAVPRSYQLCTSVKRGMK